MLAAKTERDATWGTLLFNAAHYALRPWPWIVVALPSLVVYPRYPAMLRFLPTGLLGLRDCSPPTSRRCRRI